MPQAWPLYHPGTMLPPPLHSWLHNCDHHYPNYHIRIESAAKSPFKAYVNLVDVYSSEPIIGHSFSWETPEMGEFMHFRPNYLQYS